LPLLVDYGSFSARYVVLNERIEDAS